MTDSSPRLPYWNRLETWFLTAAFLILIVTAISGWTNWREFSALRTMTARERNAFESSEAIVSSVRDAEAGQRGFLLTGKESYLEPYIHAISALPHEIADLRALAPEDKAVLDELENLVNQKLAELKETIDLRRNAGMDQALKVVATGKGWDLMDRIRATARKISDPKYRKHISGSNQLSFLSNRILDVSVGGDLILCVFLVLAAISMHAGAERREELIAELQEDERRLRDLREKAELAEEQVRKILESITDGFVSFGRSWNVTYCNAEAARILGRPGAEIVGRNFWEVFPDAAGSDIESRYRDAALNHRPVSFETFVKSRNAFWEQSVYPSRDGLSVYFRDVTERRRFEERARHSQKLESLGVLAGGIAHDFNNLLTAILGSASLMQDELPPGSPILPLAENVINASERATQLTRQMLAYSGRGRFVVESVDLAVQVREITALLESSITSQVELILDLRSKGVLIEADSGQLQQLVMNLVINGAEAIGPNGGRVVVATRVQYLDAQYVSDNLAGDNIEPGHFVLLEVHDTGVGMDEATLARIFDPFFTTKFTGRGLGLAAVLGIVRGHRGAIKVYSHPGQGTTFKVFFPVSNGQIIPKPAAPGIDFHGNATVLVVDDEEVVQKLARSALERYGYRVMMASNGKEALDVFESMADQIALVLLDMTMPVMSGEETLTRLKSLRPALKVIASSGYNEIEALRRFGNGISGFLQKPYRATQLAEKVKLTLS